MVYSPHPLNQDKSDGSITQQCVQDDFTTFNISKLNYDHVTWVASQQSTAYWTVDAVRSPQGLLSIETDK